MDGGTPAPRLGDADDPVDLSQPLKLYWGPGCSSCLRMKEFFTKRKVPFVSINILENPAAFEELRALGLKRIPLAVRGRHWADGQVLADLARIGGIPFDRPAMLAPAEMAARGEKVMASAATLGGRLAMADLGRCLPGSPRTYRQLVAHIPQIFEAFLETVEEGRHFEYAAYFRDVPADVVAPADLAAFAQGLNRRFAAWWRRDGGKVDFSARADVYYGDVSVHEFFERTLWHAAHHARQLAELVKKLGLSAEGRLTDADLAGLPLPDHVYDDKIQLAVTQ
jgi:hypothetical protein